MDRRVIVASLIAIALVLIFFLTVPASGVKTEEDARTFMVEYLKQEYPNADIVEVQSIDRKEGNYELKNRVSIGISTKCPQRLHFITKYPETGITSEAFVLPPPEEIVGKNCKVCQGKDNCQILFEEEAIVASHTMQGTQRIQEFLEAYPSAMATANLREEYAGLENVWLVKWNSNDASVPVTAIISRDTGEVKGIE